MIRYNVGRKPKIQKVANYSLETIKSKDNGLKTFLKYWIGKTKTLSSIQDNALLILADTKLINPTYFIYYRQDIF